MVFDITSITISEYVFIFHWVFMGRRRPFASKFLGCERAKFVVIVLSARYRGEYQVITHKYAS